MAINKRQATALVSKIIATTDHYEKRRLVYQFWKSNCFIVLGHSTLIKCAVELLQMNESTFYRLCKAEQTALSIRGNSSENVCDDTLRVLAPLPTKQRQLAWKLAKAKTQPGRRLPTAAQVKQVVNQLLASDQMYFD